MSGRSSGCTLRLVLGLDPRIGQLTVERDLYEGLSVKGGLVLTSMASPLFDSKAGSFSSGSD